MTTRRPYKPNRFQCTFDKCTKSCKSEKGLKQHVEACHYVPGTGEPMRRRFQSSPPLPQLPPISPIRIHSSRNPPTPSQKTPSGSPASSSQGDLPPESPLMHDSPHYRPQHSRAGSSESDREERVEIEYHNILDGTPCDQYGNDLPAGAPPPPYIPGDTTDYSPFLNRAEFELSEFLFAQEEMSEKKTNRLMEILNALYMEQGPPFADHKEMCSVIDSICHGDVVWQSFNVTYTGEVPTEGQIPAWKTQPFEVWFRDPLLVAENQLGNPDFNGQIDYAPKRVKKGGKRQYTDLMSGNWSWSQADKIVKDDQMAYNVHGAMFSPWIFGSDKTTVSVATGQNEYYPLYQSCGNVHNSVRRAHRNAVSIIGFLSIPKASKDQEKSAEFRKFRRQLFHTTLEHILSSMRPYMTQPKVTKCPDGHYRRVIYGIGPYIADYPEQALLSCIVQNWCPKCLAPFDDLDGDGTTYSRRSHEHTNALLDACTLKQLWDDFGIVGDLLPFTVSFPRADIHELLSPDLLHQIIKGTFKDHLVDWVTEYIETNFPKAEATRRLADIDRRLQCVPPFPGLRKFHEGRGFKQWTGDDSKGLMKIYLPAIVGHVPPKMVAAVRDVIEFSYLVRRHIISEDDVAEIEACIERFHQNREIFHECGIRPDGFSPLPRQHSLVHYPSLIRQFGAPNGLCSSITEAKHIQAVKKPWRRSSRHKALGQMLVVNQRLDKLAAARVDFTARGMLSGSALPFLPPPQPSPTVEEPQREEEKDMAAADNPHHSHIMSEVMLSKTYARKVPRNIHQLGRKFRLPRLYELTRRYLYNLEYPERGDSFQVLLQDCPEINTSIYVHYSARALFYAPSDLCGIMGMHRERIRATPSWRNGRARRDCIFVSSPTENDTDEFGFENLLVARVYLFFSFKIMGAHHSCALVHWFSPDGDGPDEETGMWMVTPDYKGGQKEMEVISVDSIFRGAHLIGYAGKTFLPVTGFDDTHALDAFNLFYVNKYADYHSHEIAF